MELQLKIIGVLLILLALIHPVFPWYFRWKSDLAPLQLINRQVMYVHTFFIAFAVFLMGLLCLTSPAEIAGTPLGRRIALGFGIFWSARLLVQLFGYSSKLWKGKAFETAVHIAFTLLWTYLSAVFLGIFWSSG